MRQNKFYQSKYWKHSRCMDVFLSVKHAYQKSDGSISVAGTWCTQGIEIWFFTVPCFFYIKPEEIENWHPYNPKGTIKL